MKTPLSLCFVILLSFFLLDCSQKDTSPVAPDEASSLFKGKGGGQPTIYYDVTGAITGEGQNENITLTFGQVFRGESEYFGGDDGKTGHAYNARSHGDPIFVFYFDYLEEAGGYQGRFRCEGNFERKAPLKYDGSWILEYWLDYDDKVTVTHDGGEDFSFTVEETVYRGNK